MKRKKENMRRSGSGASAHKRNKDSQRNEREKGMVKVTYEWLEKHTYRGVGLKKRQGKILGLTYPLEKGWKQKVVGMRISDEDAEKFAELGSHPRKRNAENRNSDRKFLERHKRLARERKERHENRTRRDVIKEASSETSSLSPAIHNLTFDDLEPVDLSLLGNVKLAGAIL